ncbi:hypothetical protein [Fibrella aquatilis]|uniref:Uncharacterized protein n=1 Tax=Fibrella aquatilis TaxID=2817059 RepID=A0A939JYE7_9BACT|nr:hypothetical protein [Fibrella aquatilis]MBO0933937.1 hypothetical protein [Fibrella aquatilis]
MKKGLTWVIGVPLGVLVLLGSIGLVAQCSDPKGYEQKQQEMVKQDALEQQVIDSDPADRARHDADQAALAKTEAILEKQGLSLCQVYRWIGNSEDEIRRKMEAQYGIPTAMKMSEQRDVAYTKAWQKYRKQHGIPDSLRMYINVFGMSNCQ